MFSEFKKFISRGNVVDLAIGLIIGGAFSEIVKSLVSDIINPILGLILGKTDLSKYTLVIKKASDNNPQITINYGLFLSTIINYIIVALVLFIIVRSYNKFMDKLESIKVEEKPIVKHSYQEELLMEIRDLLKK